MIVGILLAALSQDADRDFFESRVRPILVERCHACQSARAEKLKGGLRLDSRTGLLKGGNSGKPAVVPGDPAKSPLVTAIRWKDEDLRMPPKARLSDGEVATLEAWVRRGAVFPEMPAAPAAGGPRLWSLQPLRRDPPPAVRRAEWVRTPIDLFILAKLEENRLSPAPEADRRTLIRRVSFDLAGLPPSPEEVEAFTDPGNVLARRSIVNRLWQHHFGRGIVETPNDFGAMGTAPTHPELLDWLAGWFLRNGESMKKLHRLIVTSAVYRQASRGDASAARVDADNRLLWRMNRGRLDAESFRDALLLVSGRLDPRMGGPSDRQFFFKDDHSPVYDYGRFDVDSPEGRRRSVYRFIVRSVGDPFMDTLDGADPSILTPRRGATLTALQALSTLNHPFVVRQCEHLAERLKASPGPIEEAFRRLLGRPPRPEEARAFADFASRHGLANACRILVNSNEFMFVD